MLPIIVKTGIALALALLLLWLAGLWTRSRKKTERVLRSLPASRVQEIADRMDTPDELLAYLSGFFGVPFTGSERKIMDRAAFTEWTAPLHIPEAERDELLKTAGSIEPDALLAYAAAESAGTAVPAVLTVCRDADNTGLLVGIFRPERIG